MILSNSNSQGCTLSLLSEGFNLQLLFTHSLMVVAINRMEGLALLEHLEINKEKSHTDNAIACGYVREDGRVAYTDYYEAVLEARNTFGTNNRETIGDDSEFEQWYDSLDEQTTELWDAIYESVPSEADCWLLEQCKDFIDELSSYGIKSAEQWQDAFSRYDSGYDVEARFAEEYYTDCGIVDEDNPLFFAIDWEIVWRHSLAYDFLTFEFNGETWFFHNNF